VKLLTGTALSLCITAATVVEIQAAGQQHTQRNIRNHAQAHRVVEQLVELLHRVLFVARERRRVPRLAGLPRRPVRGLGGLPLSVGEKLTIVPGRTLRTPS
jgi:hypothetical protein